jgi:hypothetical protein
MRFFEWGKEIIVHGQQYQTFKSVVCATEKSNTGLLGYSRRALHLLFLICIKKLNEGNSLQ